MAPLRKPKVIEMKSANSRKPVSSVRSTMTALSKVPSIEIVHPPIKVTATFKKKATANDEQIDKTLTLIGTSYTTLGQLFSENKKQGYHAVLGFPSFADYAEAKTGKSKTLVYESMRVVTELTSGDKPVVKPEDLDSMKQENAKGLVALKKKGVKITPKMVQQAKDMPIKEFQSKVVHPQHPEAAQKAAVSQGHTIAGGANVLMDLKYKGLQPQTVADMNRAAEIARYVCREDPEDNTGLPFQDRFLQALAAEFINEHQHEYEQWKEAEGAQGIHNAVNANAATVDEDDESLIDDEDQLGGV